MTKKKGFTHSMKTGPIPDDWWENETKPGNPAKRMNEADLAAFDAKTETMRAERDAALAKKRKP